MSPPEYDYVCEEGHEFTTSQKITEPPLEKCAAANCEAPCKRLIGNTSFILKGSGWTPKGGA